MIVLLLFFSIGCCLRDQDGVQREGFCYFGHCILINLNSYGQILLFLYIPFLIIKIAISLIANSLAKLLSDSLLSNSSISQSHSKFESKSTNHIQSCNYVRACCCAFGTLVRCVLMQIFPFFHNLAILLFSEL